jgi:membrane-bound lytic murein transglycosylase B
MGGVKGWLTRAGVYLLCGSLVLLAAGCGGDRLSAETQEAAAAWEFSERTCFVEGKPANAALASLLESLASPAGQGVPLSEQEFREVLSRLVPEVYAEYVIKYATPQSVAIQNKEHDDYSKVFLKPGRIKQGVKFIADNQAVLVKASTQYNVAQKDIVAILMWESGLGEFVGSHYIVNVFLGQILYLDQARDLAVRDLISKGEADTTALKIGEVEQKRLERLKRSAVTNLAILLRVSKEKGVDATRLRGSWGGAAGFVQFMPSSMQFARDGNGDGLIDLCSWPDAIFSVANYLHENGYRDTAKARRRAIRAYNPIDSYVDGVIAFAEAVWKRHQEEVEEP